MLNAFSLVAYLSLLPTLTPGFCDAKPKAAAEVSASSGSIRLVLRLYKTKIKLGESLWHQIALQNVGTSPLVVNDEFFFDPWEMDGMLTRPPESGGFRIEILDPDGQPLDWISKRWRYPKPTLEELGGVSGLLEVDTPELEALVARWKKQGLSQREINEKLREYHIGKRLEEEIKQRQVKWLNPGETIETQSWYFYNKIEKRRKQPPPQPIGDFAELDFFDLNRPGPYRIRLVYDKRPYPELLQRLQKAGEKLKSWEVTVHTPWIPVTVQP